jgi:hypothetical protein
MRGATNNASRATLFQASCSIYLPGLAFPLALFPPLPPFVPFPPLPPFALFPPPPPFPPEAPLPDAAMASEVRLVDSNMVTAGGVTAAKRPQAFKNSRLSSSAGEPSFRSSSNCSPSFGCGNSTAVANVHQYSFLYSRCLHLTADRSTASARFSTRADAQSRTNSAPTGRR